VQNPLAKQRALMAVREQAARWLAAYREDLSRRGLGFTAEDVAAIEAAATAHPPPTAPLGWRQRLQVAKVAITATLASFPADGLREDDPRLAPVSGMSFPAYAVAARAIGWGSADPDLVARVLPALGFTVADWEPAMRGWTARIEDDVVLATMYGQLFSQVGELPLRSAS
jgi:hypothetical protein